MYSPDKTEIEQALSEIVERRGLPVTVQVTRTCTLRDEPVIKEGQTITVLNKQWVHLMYGKNWSERTFRINIAKIKDEKIQIVEEFYVFNRSDLHDVISKCKYVQLKTPLVYKLYDFEKCDKFVLSNAPENADTIILTSIRLGLTFSLPTSMVLDPKFFVFVKPGEKLSVSDFVKRSPFRPVCAEFEKTDQGLPIGIVRIEELPIYETILTVTKCSDSLIKYEFFPLHLAIPAIIKEVLFLPKQLPFDRTTQEYRHKIEEIEFIMYFDIYEARFYGYVEYEDQFRTLAVPEAQNNKMNRSLVRKSKSFSDFNSLGEDTNIYDAKPTETSKEKKKRSSNVFSSFRSKIASPTREKSKSVLGKSPKSLIKEELNEEQEPGEKYFPLTKPNEGCDLKSYKKTTINEKKEEKLSSPYRENIESDNALYGHLTMVKSAPQISATRNPRKLSPTDVQPLVSIKSAQFSEKDIRIRKKSTPLSMEASKPRIKLAQTRRAFSVSPNETEKEWDNSPPKYEKPKTLNLVKTFSVEIEVPMGARKRSFLEKQQQQRAATPDPILTNNDSGIDSPETRKSTENLSRSHDVASIRKIFEQTLPMQTNQKLESRFRSSSESHIIETPTQPRSNTLRPKSMVTENFYESVNYADVKNSFRLDDPMKQREVDSIREIKTYDKNKVLAMLRDLNMGKHEGLFKSHQADGGLITDLSELGFQQMNMSQFDAHKLYKYIHGWRPKMVSEQTSNFQDTRSWSVQDAYELLMKIQLKEFANFCLANKVDGELLLEIIESNIIKITPEIKLNAFELRKLYKFVHGWRPNYSPRSSETVNMNPENWSIQHAFDVLQKINLDRVGKFCAENQVDGSLLVDLVETEIIYNLPASYGLSLIEIEWKRLQREVKGRVDTKLQSYF